MTEGKHIAIVTDEAPDIWYKSKRVIRTVLQVIVSTAVTIVGLAAVFPDVVDAIQDVLPETWAVWLAGAVTFLSALAGALARVMAIPAVNDFLTRFGAGSVPKDTVRH